MWEDVGKDDVMEKATWSWGEQTAFGVRIESGSMGAVMLSANSLYLPTFFVAP